MQTLSRLTKHPKQVNLERKFIENEVEGDVREARMRLRWASTKHEVRTTKLKIEYFGFVAHPKRVNLERKFLENEVEGAGVRSAHAVAVSKRKARRPYRKNWKLNILGL